MGLFSSKKSAIEPGNKVWKTRQACLKGIVREALLALKDGKLPVLITFFNESHRNLSAFIESSGVPYQNVDAFSGKDFWQNKNTLVVADVSASSTFINNISVETKVVFLLLGRYPLLSTENTLVGMISARFPQALISFCLSMEDALFESFGSTSLKAMMETLGMGDDECIEHTMINRALRNALEKISQRVTAEMKTTSERDWFTRNAPD